MAGDPGHAPLHREQPWLGLAQTAEGIRNERPHRANGELAYHVLDIMHAIHDASTADST